MNLFQLVFKQMRQRALSTWLTLLSVLLGVGLATAILLFQREGAKLFGQTDFGYDLIIGPKGNKLQLVLNTAYHLSMSPGTIPYSYYENFPELSSLDWAVPYVVGDNYKGYRVVGTLPKMFKGFAPEQKRADALAERMWSLVGTKGDDAAAQRPAALQDIRRQAEQLRKDVELEAPDAASRLQEAVNSIDSALKATNASAAQQSALASLRAAAVLLGGPGEYRRGRTFELAQGRLFHPKKFEAVIGSDVAKRAGLSIGSTFRPTHGAEQTAHAEEHKEQWTVVGILKPTYTANDRAIFIPLVSFYAIPSHEEGLKDIAEVRGTATTQPAHAGHEEHEHEAHTINPDGTIDLKVPKNEWLISAILARTNQRSSLGMEVLWAVNNGPVAMAVSPSDEMLSFFNTFLKGSSDILLLVSLLVTVVASVSILVSIYNSVSARRKEIAILRALGATRARVLAIICVEAGLVGLFGGLAGLVVGHILGAGGSLYLKGLMGEGIAWLTIDRWEGLYLLVVVALAVLAGLVPATKAYRTPVATNLVAA